jgi:cell division transport system permease protein
MLPSLVAAMALLAALAMGGWTGASGLSRHWREGAAAALTVQVPNPGATAARDGGTRLAAVVAALTGTPGVASARPLDEEELGELLRPWLGVGAERVAVPLPAVVAVRVNAGLDLPALSRQLGELAPGTQVEDHGVWIGRLAALARSLQACAGLALVLVIAVAATVIAVATRAGLASRREAIEIVHGLGATDGYIAGRFAARATLLAAIGGLVGAILATPVLLMLARLAAPFTGTAEAGDTVGAVLAALPPALWLALPALPLVAAVIGYLTAQATVRRWLRQLP